MPLHLFQFSLRDQANNWLERLPARSITTWDDLTTRFLAQFFPLGRTAKLQNDILMFQQHHGESLSEAWTRFKDLLQKVPHHGIDLWLQVQIFMTIPRDFTKPVKAIALPQDVLSTSDRHFIKLENQVQRLMEAHLAPTQPTQVSKITTSCEICSGPHDTQYCMDDSEKAYVDYASLHTNKMRGKRFTPNQGPRNFNDAANIWKEKPNFNWARSQTFTNRKNGSISVNSFSYQMKLEKVLLDFESNQEKRLSHLRTQLGQQQDDMIGKINLLWKTVSEKLNDVSTPEKAGNFMATESNAAISHVKKEELGKKGIKSPSKLFSPKYLSPASIKEINENPSAPKHDLGKIMGGNEEVKEQGKEEDEMETDMKVEEVIEEEESEFETDEEVEEIHEEEEENEDDENFNSFPTMKELSHHEWLLKNPRPPWVKARIRAESLNNIKISCMIGHFFKKHAYIDLESPINIMSRHKYNQIMTYGLRSRQKPSNPDKISNFVGRVRSLKIFIGSFACECDFMILEDTISIIDRCLGEMVFRRPFIDETGLVYDKKERTVMFKQDNGKIKFKMPYTMEIFKQTRLMVASTDSIPSLVYEENFSNGRTHYYQSLLIGDEYRQDEGDRR
nr:MAK10-like protein [Tanacetum cinerariifolium]